MENFKQNKMNKKKFTSFRPEIRTRHQSHSKLRRQYKLLPLLPFRSIIRLGSTTIIKDGKDRVELNTPEAVQNSSNKRLMKKVFADNNIKTPIWNYLEEMIAPTEEDKQIFFTTEVKGSNDSILLFPVIIKNKFGSRGRGNTKINNIKELITFLDEMKSEHNDYIIEKYYDYNREYRIHVDMEGGFYFLRKMLKEDTPKEDRWFRNDSNSVWIMEENELFDAPVNLKEIEKQALEALVATGLDFGAVDVKVQSKNTTKGALRKKNPKFTIIEINSAPSFGDITLEKYVERLPIMLKNKHNLLSTTIHAE